MTIRTAITDRFELSVPVFQAPMAGGGDTAELVSAVSNAGAMGFIGAAYLTPEQILERARQVRAQTSRAFGINLFAPVPAPIAQGSQIDQAIARVSQYYKELGLPAPTQPTRPASRFDDQLASCLECGAAAFSFAFGLLPPATIQNLKRKGIFVLGTATTVKEGQQLVEAGVEAVIVQGSEAGGHRSTFGTSFEQGMVGSISLVPQVASAIAVPIIASGGIMDGRGIAAAIVLGASAAQMGTAFLTCNESGIPQGYKQAILNTSEDQTKITRAFSGRPARGIINRVLADYDNHLDTILPFPLQNALTRPLRAAATKQDRPEYLSLWAGQGLRLARRTSATDLVQRLSTELVEAIDSLQPETRRPKTQK